MKKNQALGVRVSMIKYPPLLLKYLKMFQDDPSSRIFAPLAECYRKIGLVDEAIEICKEGLISNPHFIGGKVALARAYFDKQMYVKVKDLLQPVIEHIPDNLIAQRLLADSSLLLGFLNEALQAYKMLLYFNPDDKEVASIVLELETQGYENINKTNQPKHSPEQIRKLMKLQNMLQAIRKLDTSSSRCVI